MSGSRPVSVPGLRHAAERMTASWNSPTSAAKPRPRAPLALHSRIRVVYFGVRRRVAKGNTGGVAGFGGGGREGGNGGGGEGGRRKEEEGDGRGER